MRKPKPRHARRQNDDRLQFRLSGRTDQADDPARHPEGGGDPRLSGAFRQPRDAAALRLGHRRHPGDRGRDRGRRRAEGHRPGCGRHHQRRLHPALLRAHGRHRHDRAHDGSDHHPDPPPHPRGAAARGADPGLSGPHPRAAALAGGARDGNAAHARTVRLWRHACEAVRGHRAPWPHRHHLRLSGHGGGPLFDAPLADPEIR